MPREIALDCRYFAGDRPCYWHKREGAVCTCDYYAPIRQRILIVKLDAMGDVLRTTCLLPALADVHPEGAFTWITRPEALPLLTHNPYLAEAVPLGPETVVMLLTRSFDRVINLDASKVSAGLAAVATSPRKDGFILDPAGNVTPTNESARAWLEMGLFDDLKKKNTRTYQSIMAEILGLNAARSRYVLELTDIEWEQAKAQVDDLGVDRGMPIVGLNTGAGERWPLKQWRLDGYCDLIRRLYEELGVQVLLLGGPAERYRHEFLLRNALVPVFDCGNENSLRRFAALVGQCHVLVSGDTLAMHLALALNRRVVVLFGPTSAAEIELYGLGEKIVPDMECLVCYKGKCDLVPNCMDVISVEAVAHAVNCQLREALSTSEVGPYRPKAVPHLNPIVGHVRVPSLPVI
jgi:heptosyltransferase-2